MDIDIRDLLVRFLRRARADSGQFRALLTAALFMDFDGRIRELLDRGGQPDSDLVREIAAVASPIELAVMLGHLGTFLPAECFSALFSQVRESTSDVRALRELGLAAAHYHDAHPGAVDVPAELAELLLNSPDEDARVVGLKVLRRCYPDAPTFLRIALEALANGTAVERVGAGHELIEVLDDPTHRFLSALPADMLADLRASLERASRSDGDPCARENATNALRLVGFFETDRG